MAEHYDTVANDTNEAQQQQHYAQQENAFHTQVRFTSLTVDVLLYAAGTATRSLQ